MKGWKLLKRYAFLLAMVVASAAVWIAAPDVGQKAAAAAWDNTLQLLSVVPPIFVLIGLLDVWVERRTMVRFMGGGSGIKGALIAFILGSATAGPLYIAFPVAAMLMKKGARLFNAFVFIGAWSTTKFPLLLFEASELGWRFMLTRFAVNIAGIVLIALVTEKLLSESDVAQIYARAEKTDA
jgi:uncharacterized membrane protein YraQ (UPF0718 family)